MKRTLKLSLKDKTFKLKNNFKDVENTIKNHIPIQDENGFEYCLEELKNSIKGTIKERDEVQERLDYLIELQAKILIEVNKIKS